MTPSPHSRDRQPDRRRESKRRRRTPSPSGRKRLFTRSDSEKERTKKSSGTTERSLWEINLDLPPGPVIQVYSTVKRQDIATFLMNSSRVHTAFRFLLEGPAGGFEGPLDGLVLAYLDEMKTLAALAIMPDRTWYVHSQETEALAELLGSVPENLSPRKIEGEPGIVEKTVEYLSMQGLNVKKTVKCIHMETVSRLSVQSTGGMHRLAKLSDITRLEEYAHEFRQETGEEAKSNWHNMITDKMILLGIVEGTIASVAIRSASTIDMILIEGVYTFKPFRRRGLAKRLVTTITGQSLAHGQTTTAIVPITNTVMSAFLEGLGFHKSADYLVAKY